MAPKRKASKATKAVDTQPGPADETKENAKLDNDGAYKVRRFSRSRRDLDQKVQRSIELHFSHFPRFLVENKVVGGKSLRDRILADMEGIEGTTARLGTRYWANLRAEYGASLDPCANLIVKNIDEKVSDTLISALTHFTSVNPAARTAEPLCSFLSQQACHAEPETLTKIRGLDARAWDSMMSFEIETGLVNQTRP
jgi:hypothetical protein